MFLSVCVVSEGALQETMAAAAGRTLVLPTKPVHHVTGVSSVTAAQAEVGGASYGHVADGALEGQTFTDGTLSPTSLTATVAAVHPKLCRDKQTDSLSETWISSRKAEMPIIIFITAETTVSSVLFTPLVAVK